MTIEQAIDVEAALANEERIGRILAWLEQEAGEENEEEAES